jgi:hypothetical protein
MNKINEKSKKCQLPFLEAIVPALAANYGYSHTLSRICNHFSPVFHKISGFPYCEETQKYGQSGT